MSARPPIELPPLDGLRVVPDEEHAQLALREARVLMAPVVRWLMRHGVHYGAFAEMLKGVFVSVAREELARARAKTTDSAISVMSGVHRKDVRAIGADPQALPLPRCIPLAAQVLSRWRSDASFLDPSGEPRPLARGGALPSFEALAREISSDVHPRTLLDELLRLGLVTLEDDLVRVARPIGRPAPGLEQGVAEFSTSAADHIAAAVHNLTIGAPQFLARSVFVEGLTAEAVQRLHDAARELWDDLSGTLATHAAPIDAAEAATEGASRVRLGVYYYSEPAKASTGR